MYPSETLENQSHLLEEKFGMQNDGLWMNAAWFHSAVLVFLIKLVSLKKIIERNNA